MTRVTRVIVQTDALITVVLVTMATCKDVEMPCWYMLVDESGWKMSSSANTCGHLGPVT